MSALITGLVRRYALAHDVVDVPNERSSHRAPTPRGGGVAIVLVSTAALGVLAVRGLVRPELLWAVGVGGVAVALVGLADDHRSLPFDAASPIRLDPRLQGCFAHGGARHSDRAED